MTLIKRYLHNDYDGNDCYHTSEDESTAWLPVSITKSIQKLKKERPDQLHSWL